jgi:ribonuclease HI
VSLQHKRLQRVTKHKYLGITINQFFSPKEHIQSIREKSRRLTIKLSQIYNRSWGISNLSAKRIYLGVIEPVILYGSSAWYDGTVRMEKNLANAQRTPLLKISNAFKTVSTEALQILTGILPIDLRIRELQAYRKFLKNGKYDSPEVSKYHPGITLIEKVDCIPNYLEENIFTDGSKSGEGSAAAMVHLNKQTVVHISKRHLSSNADNYVCELEGILLALNHMTYNRVNLPIFTDSQAAIASLTNDKPKCKTALLILEEAFKLKSVIRIAWIKGHSGDLGNDLADQNAKLGCNESNIKHIYSSPSRLKRNLKIQSMNYWKERWSNSKNGRPLFQFIQEPSKSTLLTNFYTNQFLTGHGFFPSYFKRFHLRNAKCLCNATSYEEANPAHYINKCPAFLSISREYFQDKSWSNKKRVFCALATKLEEVYSTKIHKDL